jgi:ArsR family transcriptional regulator
MSAATDRGRQSDFLKALAHPVRLRMVRGLLSRRECNVGAMARSLGVPQSTASQHLRILKNCGIVAFRKEGARTCYHIADGRVRGIMAALGG